MNRPLLHSMHRCMAVWALVLLAGLAHAAPPDAAYAEAVQALPEASFREKAALVAALVTQGHPNARPLLAAMLDNRLYADDRGVFIADADTTADAEPVWRDALTLNPADVSLGSRDRIRTNNSLRAALKVGLAQFDLADPDAKVRIAAVRELSGDLDDDVLALLRAQQATDDAAAVRREIDIALAVYQLKDDDPALRLAAIEVLDGEQRNLVYNRVKPLTDPAHEPDAAVRAAASRVVAGIDGWREIYGALETLFFGLSLGSVLVLAAIGLAISFGVMGVINMAHGELIMLGAYTTYVMQLLLPNHIGLALVLAVPAAFLVSGLVGVAIERGIIRFLYGRPLETLLATFGLSLILQQVVRSIFSPLNRSVTSPDWMQGLWQINDLFSVTYNRLAIILFMLVVFALLLLVMNRTSLGLKVRAVSQNRAMAKAMGVRTARVDALTFGLGSGIAGIAGVALSQLTNVGPNLGQAYIVDSFMVVVFGGVGNLWGTLISGLSLGVLNKLLEPAAGAVMAKILVLIGLILFIQRRPKGLFPQKGRAAEGH
ncbi:MAG: urea ABC transporter permease subunit UrtB [Polycyclovorans sp.]|jgi:urea transport system permease protein|nr:urea ABC transporter permease subunit UrtB [Polycyclovorans sp.]MEC8847909.1 urea ABC transporter permease subunit UrtB [Pseudomonadota bacterium]